MRRHPNIVIGLIFAAVLAVGAIQGQRVDNLREAEAFYRWIINAATQARLGNLEDEYESEEEYKDEELFQAVAEVMEYELPGTPPLTEEGDIPPQIIRSVRDGIHDKEIWQAARSDALAEQRRNFLEYRRNEELYTLGTQFGVSDLYASDANVNIANLFFGFRKVAANFVWLQVDKFWHAGQVHRMIPSMRTTVALDPNFVDAYLLGAWHMAYNITAQLPVTPPRAREWNPKYKAWLGKRETYYYLATDFLKDGIRKNPRDYRLYFDLGYAVYYQKIKDYENAVRYLSEAVRYPHERWVPRMLNISLQKNGQYADAIAGWERYLERFPGNATAIRHIKINTGLLHERNAETLQRQAATLEEEGKLQEAAEKRDQAEQQIQQAREIWRSLDQGQGDVFAKARLLRLEALDFAEEDRYLEAVASLDEGRWASGEHFEEFSDLIIELKQKGDVPLSLSEKLAVDRKKREQELLERTPDTSS